MISRTGHVRGNRPAQRLTGNLPDQREPDAYASGSFVCPVPQFYHAAVQVGRPEFDCDAQNGSLRDAILYACGANAAHGLRRTNGDKRRAVETLLKDDEWSQWSDHEIARRCIVTRQMVSAQRVSLATVASDNRIVTH